MWLFHTCARFPVATMQSFIIYTKYVQEIFKCHFLTVRFTCVTDGCALKWSIFRSNPRIFYVESLTSIRKWLKNVVRARDNTEFGKIFIGLGNGQTYVPAVQLENKISSWYRYTLSRLHTCTLHTPSPSPHTHPHIVIPFKPRATFNVTTKILPRFKLLYLRYAIRCYSVQRSEREINCAFCIKINCAHEKTTATRTMMRWIECGTAPFTSCCIFRECVLSPFLLYDVVFEMLSDQIKFEVK